MVRYFILCFSFGLLVSCGYSSDKQAAEKNGPGDGITENPDYQKGLALIGKSDCLTCHKVDERVNGPSYREVAEKYAGETDTVLPYLAKKIINGSTGTWGSVFMTPHPSVSQEDAEAMVKYILLLKK